MVGVQCLSGDKVGSFWSPVRVQVFGCSDLVVLYSLNPMHVDHAISYDSTGDLGWQGSGGCDMY